MPRKKQAVRGRAERDRLVLANLTIPKGVYLQLVYRERHPQVRRLGMEEAIAAGYEGLLRSAELWVEGAGKKFTSYAWTLVRFKIISCARAAELIRVPHGKPRPQRAPIIHQKLANHRTPTALPMEITELLGLLTGREEETVRLIYFDGLSRSETGRRLGISRQRVGTLEKNALKKLRRLWNRGGY